MPLATYSPWRPGVFQNLTSSISHWSRWIIAHSIHWIILHLNASTSIAWKLIKAEKLPCAVPCKCAVWKYFEKSNENDVIHFSRKPLKRPVNDLKKNYRKEFQFIHMLWEQFVVGERWPRLTVKPNQFNLFKAHRVFSSISRQSREKRCKLWRFWVFFFLIKRCIY